ncbi:outer membrane beta-barrel protein [uncultured Alteromonas sp.]|uniref:outer membrane beta-barrel protein n=1 Tax=uncultured Alteromonas sp. TaxID=179113 RepID=UPI0025DDF1BB|nr:outer membrane beta-barrel protein [uncultured Alteromonas sp.]
MRLISTRTLTLASLVMTPLCMADGVVLDNGAQVNATVLVGVGYDSNVALMNENELSSSFWETEGQLGLSLNPGAMEHVFDFLFNDRHYTDSEQDDFTDWSASYAGHYEPTSRHRADVSMSTTNFHQQRGIGYTRYLDVPLSEPLQYTQNDASLAYEYGSEAAIGQLGAELSYLDYSFDNFSDFTERLNYSAPTVHAWFDYNVGAVTSLTLDLSAQDISYDIVDVNGSRDSLVSRALIGAKWSGLAKTTGRFKLGIENRDFDSNLREDFTGLTIDAGVIWKPKTYSTVDMSLTRRTSESGFSNLIVNTTFEVDWQHAWSDITSTAITYQFLNLDEEGSNERTEKRNYVGLAYSRQLAEWLTVNAEYSVTMNSSTLEGFDYDNQVIMLGFKGAI